jgi:hypothetical protein
MLKKKCCGLGCGACQERLFMTWHLRNIFAGEGGSSGIKSHLQDHRQERIYTPDGIILGLFGV